MTTIAKFEYLLLINCRLQAYDLPVVCTCGRNSSSGVYLVLHNTVTDRQTFPEFTDSIESIIEQARELCKPKYTPIKRVYLDSLDTTVYLDKLTPVTISSISSDGVSIFDGSNTTIVDNTRLFIKE